MILLFGKFYADVNRELEHQIQKIGDSCYNTGFFALLNPVYLQRIGEISLA
jgi:hypothetical protein